MKKLIREPNFWIGVGLVVVVIPLLIWAIVTHRPEDRVGIIAPGLEEGASVSLRPAQGLMPWTVISDKTVNQNYLARAVSNLEDQAKRELWVLRSPETGCEAPLEHEDPHPCNYGRVYLTVEEIHGERASRCGGITIPMYDKRNGDTYTFLVKINRAHSYSEKHYIAALEHELGHTLLLDDDDDWLRSSIMSGKLSPRGRLTEIDLAHVRGLNQR